MSLISDHCFHVKKILKQEKSQLKGAEGPILGVFTGPEFVGIITSWSAEPVTHRLYPQKDIALITVLN